MHNLIDSIENIQFFRLLGILKGLSTTHRYVGRQKVEIEYEDLILLLNEEDLNIEKLSAASKAQLEVNGGISFSLFSESIFSSGDCIAIALKLY